MTTDEKAAMFGALCDVAARLMYDIPDDDPSPHTSDEARRLAVAAWNRAGL